MTWNTAPPALYTHNQMGWLKNQWTVKALLTKALHEKRDPYIALLDYRNTPLSDSLGSQTHKNPYSDHG